MDGAPDSAQRGSADLWLSAAYEALVGQGIDAVKILPLAARLGLSRTSFYWFFRDRAALLDALAAAWEGRTTAPLIAATRAYAGSAQEAMLNVSGCFMSDRTFDHRMEFAVRGWALRDPAMLVRLHAADNARLEALRAMLADWGFDPAEADVRARTVYLVQIGYIATQTTEDLTTRIGRVAHYVTIFTGQPPTGAEMARFTAAMTAGAQPGLSALGVPPQPSA